MSAGPGNYDRECTIVRELTQAHAVVVVVVGGTKGNGFSVQSMTAEFTKDLPKLLRHMADDIEKDL